MFSVNLNLIFSESFGYDSLKKYNLNILDDENIIYISGISYIIMNINTKEGDIEIHSLIKGRKI